MSITLDNLTLPDDLYWADEFGWTPVATSLDYLLSGSALIQTGTRLAGRAVTLQSEDDEHCWTSRATVLALKALADEAGKIMTLNYHGRSLRVMFAPGEIPFDAEPLWREWPDADADTWLLSALRLIEIPAEAQAAIMEN